MENHNEKITQALTDGFSRFGILKPVQGKSKDPGNFILKINMDMNVLMPNNTEDFEV